MSQEKTEAMVLRGVDFSESSRIVTFLSPQRGRLACIAKGVRKKNSRSAALLDTFNRVELIYYWKEARQVQIFAEASLLNDFRPLKQDLEKGAYAAFPLEIAYKTAHENEPSEALYESLRNGMEKLAIWEGDIRTHIAWQILDLMCVAGYEPALTHCGQCMEALAAIPTGFSWTHGVVCPQCRADRKLSQGAYEALTALLAHTGHCPLEEAPEEIFTLLQHYASHQLECSFRSLRVLHQMFG